MVVIATAETARLIASLELQTQKFDAGFGKVASGMDRLDQRFAKSTSFWKHSVSTAFGVGLERAVSAGIRGVFGALNAGIASLQEQGQVVAQTNAAIKSTGGAAHVSAAQVRELSEATEAKTAIDDKQIQTAANLLLTFTNVRNEQGKGNDVFNQSVSVLADLATAMGTDASSGAIQLGKALNDPVKGITALTRIGVTFDASQKKRIEGFVKEGKIIEAQKIILAELNKEFGGSGAAFAATDAGKAAKFADAVEDIQKAFASGLLPAITRVRETLTKFLSDPATVGQIEQVGNAIAGIFSEGNIKTAASAMTTAANAIGTAIKLFSGLPKEVQALAVGAVALKKITGIGPLDIVKGAGGLIKMVFERGATPANPLFVTDVAGAAGKGIGGAAGAAGGLSAFSKVFLVGEAIGLALLVNEVRNGIADGNTATSEALVKQTHEWLAQNPSKAELKNGLGGVEDAIKNLESSNLPLSLVQGEALDNLRVIRKLILTQIGDGNLALRGLGRSITRAGDLAARGLGNKISAIEAATVAMQSQLHADLQAAVGVLKTSNDPAAIAAAVTQAVKDIRGGAGSATSTGGLLDTLKTQLAAAEASNNKPLAAQIRDAIKQIEPFQKGRQWQAEQIAKANQIVTSNKSTADKVAGLRSIQQDLLSHQRTMAADEVAHLIAIETAVKGIKLPAGQTPVIRNGFVVGGTPLPTPGKTPEIRNGFVINVNPKLSFPIGDVRNTTVVSSRIGPTPAEAGG